MASSSCAECIASQPDEACQQLLKKIVERVFVYEGRVLAVVVHGDFGVVLGENQKASADIADALEGTLAAEGLDCSRSFDGSDGGAYSHRITGLDWAT